MNQDDWDNAASIDSSVSKIAELEKQARSPEFGLHRWFARRPLVLGRVATYLTLSNGIDHNSDTVRLLSEPHLQDGVVEKVTDLILGSQMRLAQATGLHTAPAGKPRVLDPFAGGGSLAIEALRLGCDVDVCELSPVAASILRATIDYPHRLNKASAQCLDGETGYSWKGIQEEFEIWRVRLTEIVTKRWELHWPIHSRPAYSVWGHFASCPASECGAAVPLVPHIELSRPGRKNDNGSVLSITIKEDGIHASLDAATSKGTHHRDVVCQCCGRVLSADELAEQKILKRRPQLIANAVRNNGKLAWSAANSSREPDTESRERLSVLLEKPFAKSIERCISHELGRFVRSQGAEVYRDLFSDRQLLIALEFLDAAQVIDNEMKAEGLTLEQREALATYFSFGLASLIQKNSVMSRWNASNRRPTEVFQQLSLPFCRYFVETDPAGILDQWASSVRTALKRLCLLPSGGSVLNQNAQALPFENDCFDGIVTDPPYYDCVPYTDISEFFWVWESQMFPRDGEIAGDANRLNQAPFESHASAEQRYQEEQTAVFQECLRVLKPGRLMALLIADSVRKRFDAYVLLAERAGFEVFKIHKIANPDSQAGGFGSVTTREFLVYFRKPVPNEAAPTVVADAQTLLQAVDESRPVMYEAIAQLLMDEIDPSDLQHLYLSASKGTEIERLQEVVAQADDLRVLLEQQLGRKFIRSLANDKGLIRVDNRDADPTTELLQYFGFRIPPPGQLDGVHQVIENVRRIASVFSQTRESDELAGHFTNAAKQVESLVRRGIDAWCEIAFGSGSLDAKRRMLTNAEGDCPDVSRLSFGKYVELLRKLPDEIANSDAVELVRQKFGRTHIYTTKAKKGTPLAFMNDFVNHRNNVAHDKVDIESIRDQLLASLKQLPDVLVEMVATRMIPQSGRVVEVTTDLHNRRTYVIRLDDGTAFKGVFSNPIELGAEYYFFGSEVNPMPVDPVMIPVAAVSPIRT